MLPLSQDEIIRATRVVLQDLVALRAEHEAEQDQLQSTVHTNDSEDQAAAQGKLARLAHNVEALKAGMEEGQVSSFPFSSNWFSPSSPWPRTCRAWRRTSRSYGPKCDASVRRTSGCARS